MNVNNFFKDPIYGEISFEKDFLFLELISSKDFLRLKNINQLGVCCWIFHTATHNRFSHSLGVYHLAKIFMKHLNISLKSYEAKVVMVAALLHDIGHGPFSHVFEKISQINHEFITRKIIENENTEINSILKKHNIKPKDVSNIYLGKAKKPWMWQIITSAMDVDRMDYILRDAYMIGTKYGTIDIPLLISRTKLDLKGYIIHSYRNKNIVQAFLQARIFMREDVYENNNVLLYEWVLINIFVELKKNKDFLIKKSKNILHWNVIDFLILEKELKITKFNIKKYLFLNDNILLDFIRCMRDLNINQTLNSLIDSFFSGNGLEWKNTNNDKNFFSEKNYGLKTLKLNYDLIEKTYFKSYKERFHHDILFYDVKEDNSKNIWFSNLLVEKSDNIKTIHLVNKNFICQKKEFNNEKSES